MIAHDPLHRSGRAALPHPAPTLGDDAKTHERIRMADASRRKPAGHKAPHPSPRQVIALASTAKYPPPEATDSAPEGADGRAIHGHAVIAYMPQNDRAHISTLLRDGRVQAPPQFGFHLVQLGLPPLSHRLAQHREPALARLPAAMREAKEVKGLRFALAPRSPALRREAAKADEARLVRMQLQTELRESLAKLSQKPLGLVPMLESDHEVIGVAHEHHIALSLPRSPSLDPKVEPVVQVKISQERADFSAYAKTNFQFERVVTGWRGTPVFDFRLKR